MLSTGVIKVIIVVALAAHGLAHAIALSGLVQQVGGTVSGSALTVRSWLLPDLGSSAAAALAVPFWLLATVGFFAAAVSFWGIAAPDWPWRQIAVGAALVSTAGIVLFSAIWPGGEEGLRVVHIGAAMAMNLAVLVTQLLLHWPTEAMVAR